MSSLHAACMRSYDAATAGLSYSIDFTTKGLRLAFGGWNDKMPDFIQYYYNEHASVHVTAVATTAMQISCRVNYIACTLRCHRYHCALLYNVRTVATTTDCSHYCCAHVHMIQQRVTETLVQHVPTDSKLFERLRDVVRRDLQSFDQQQPYYHAIVASALCLEEPKYAIEDVRATLDSITMADVAALTKRVFAKCYGVALLQ
eukprot:18727-Heterococcus_DN1.PRE.1